LNITRDLRVLGLLSVLVGIGIVIWGCLEFFTWPTRPETGDFVRFSGLGIVCIVGGILSIIAARGITKGKKSARRLAFVLSLLMLPGIPIATIFGIILLVKLSNSEVSQYTSN
jgi:hypothetical protein